MGCYWNISEITHRFLSQVSYMRIKEHLSLGNWWKVQSEIPCAYIHMQAPPCFWRYFQSPNSSPHARSVYWSGSWSLPSTGSAHGSPTLSSPINVCVPRTPPPAGLESVGANTPVHPPSGPCSSCFRFQTCSDNEVLSYRIVLYAWRLQQFPPSTVVHRPLGPSGRDPSTPVRQVFGPPDRFPVLQQQNLWDLWRLSTSWQGFQAHWII